MTDKIVSTEISTSIQPSGTVKMATPDGKKEAAEPAVIAPTRLEFNADVYGRSLPLWHYTFVPEGMRRAEVKDLTRARPVLYRVEAGPDKGDWYSDYVRESTYRILCRMIRDGKEVWVR